MSAVGTSSTKAIANTEGGAWVSSDVIRAEARLLISLLQKPWHRPRGTGSNTEAEQAAVRWAWCAHRALSVDGVTSHVSEPWEKI